MVRLSTCAWSIAPGVLSRPLRMMRHGGRCTPARPRSKRYRTGCLYREGVVLRKRVWSAWLIATAKEFGDLFIPSKAVEFPNIPDFIEGKHPAQAGIFKPLHIDEAEEGICRYFTTYQCKANAFPESVC